MKLYYTDDSCIHIMCCLEVPLCRLFLSPCRISKFAACSKFYLHMSLLAVVYSSGAAFEVISFSPIGPHLTLYPLSFIVKKVFGDEPSLPPSFSLYRYLKFENATRYRSTDTTYVFGNYGKVAMGFESALDLSYRLYDRNRLS